MKRAHWLTVALLIAPALWASEKAPAPTIADLKKKALVVKPSTPPSVDAQQLRDSYEQFLSLNDGDSALRAEAMRRLGDLKLEDGEYQRIEQELAQGSPLATHDAITLYSALLKTFADYPRRDAVLYQLARAQEADSQIANALQTLDKLVTDYPRSVYVAEANFRLGEIYFSQKQYAPARRSYAAIVQAGTGSEFYEQALYKQGWSEFKLGDGDTANATFGRLLDRLLLKPAQPATMVDLTKLSRPLHELLDDTLRVMALTFSYNQGAQSVDVMSESRGPRPYDYLLYSSLGDLYVEQSRYTDAAQAYRAFAVRSPSDSQAPIMEQRSIEAYQKGGFANLVLQGKREYVERYGVSQPFWANRTLDSAPQVVSNLKGHLQDLAAYYHEQAQNSKKSADYVEAAHWYREFLNAFPKDAAALSANYLLADSLFDNHDYAQATVEYEHTAYDYPVAEKSAPAGYAALVAYEKHEASLSGAPAATWHQQALASAVRFAHTFPSHPESIAVLTRAARGYYDLKDYAQARQAASQVLQADLAGHASEQRTAWTVLANTDFETQDFAAAERDYLHLQGLLPAGDSTINAINERLAASVYQQAQARVAAGDSAGAVADFLRVGQVAPGSSVNAPAQLDAANLLMSSKDWSGAITVLESYRRAFPAAALAADVTAKMAVSYRQAGDLLHAAPEFERLSSDSGQSVAVQREALQEAASLYQKALDLPQARRVLSTYLSRFPEPYAEALEVRQSLADIALSLHDAKARSEALAGIVRADRAANSPHTDRSRYLAAKASLELAAPSRDAFVAIHLVAPLKKSLEAKKVALTRALEAYKVANDYAVAEVSTAATFEMAQLYRQLGQDLLHSERPAGLKADELEQYDTLLEEQAFPFEEKAIALHEINIDRIADGLYDASIARSYGALTELNAGRYRRSEQSEDFVVNSPAQEIQSALKDAVAQASARHYDQAQTALNALAEQNPTVAVVRLNQAMLAFRQGHWDEAEIDLNQAQALDDGTLKAVLWAQRGLVYRAQGNLEQAQSAYRTALSTPEQQTHAARNLAILLDVYANQPSGAVEYYEQAVKLSSNDRALRAWWADAKYRSSGANTSTGSAP